MQLLVIFHFHWIISMPHAIFSFFSSYFFLSPLISLLCILGKLAGRLSKSKFFCATNISVQKFCDNKILHYRTVAPFTNSVSRGKVCSRWFMKANRIICFMTKSLGKCFWKSILEICGIYDFFSLSSLTTTARGLFQMI